MSQPWTALIPARGGSKEVRNKNLQLVGGKPLVIRSIELLKLAGIEEIVVSTDSNEIWSTVLSHYGEQVKLIHRDPLLALDTATVDDVVADYIKRHAPERLLVLQPSTYGLDPAHVLKLIKVADHVKKNLVGTVDSSHIYWKGKLPIVKERKNRQTLAPVQKEIGLRAYANPGELKLGPLPLDASVIEIDTVADLRAAQSNAATRTVIIEFAAEPNMGLGHLYRSMAIRDALAHHETYLVSTAATTETARVLAGAYHASPPETSNSGVWILDTLDTDAAYVLDLKGRGWKVVTLEDEGSGMIYADATINSLYGSGTHNGVDYAVLRPEFTGLPPFEVKEEARDVLISFGGEDPKDLGPTVQQYFVGSQLNTTWLFPPANQLTVNHMAASMMAHDLLITSAGRTLYEAAAVGIPTIAIAANQREARHLHLGPMYGNVYMGLAEEALADATTVPRTVSSVLGSLSLRKEMSERSRKMVDGRGLERIVRIVEGLL